MRQLQISMLQMKTFDASDADPLDSEAASFNFDTRSNASDADTDASDAEPASNADIPKWGLAEYRSAGSIHVNTRSLIDNRWPILGNR